MYQLYVVDASTNNYVYLLPQYKVHKFPFSFLIWLLSSLSCLQ